MPNVKVYDVDAPDEIAPGESFYIAVKVLRTSLPWWLGGKITGVFSILDKEGNEIARDRHIYKPWWFWGYSTISFEVHNLEDTAVFSLDVGWSE